MPDENKKRERRAQIPMTEKVWIELNSRKRLGESFDDVLLKMLVIVKKYESGELIEKG